MLRKWAIAAALAALPCTALAQDAAAPVVDSGDTAWILAASALVLLMTLPGLGAVLRRAGAGQERALGAAADRRGRGVASLLWIVVGYTLAFGDVEHRLARRRPTSLDAQCGLDAVRAGRPSPKAPSPCSR